ncbi:MAG TPA: NAD(P)-binding protein [Acidimicrobiia bacterium]|nr:NAD(P)-binding protein [Acidimicrobiia bacterium]
MSAAQELAERGYAVEVFERNPQYVGGKARSVDVPGTNTRDPDRYLPGEHGFRFFPGFYKHVTDTMSRIPFRRADGTLNSMVVSTIW